MHKLFDEDEVKKIVKENKQLKRDNKKLREALKPMTTGTYWIGKVAVDRARKALGIDA